MRVPVQLPVLVLSLTPLSVEGESEWAEEDGGGGARELEAIAAEEGGGEGGEGGVGVTAVVGVDDWEEEPHISLKTGVTQLAQHGSPLDT